jgi:RNA polymerase sigma-70 factor (ECF subfamily)
MDRSVAVCDHKGMIPEQRDVRELLQRIRQGDSGAVDQLLGRHREPIRRMIALRLDAALAPRIDASDVVQEVLLEANRRLRDYLRNPRLPFFLWLRQIARDRIVDAHRRHRQAQRRSLDREQSLDESAQEEPRNGDAVFVDQELTPASAAMWHELQRRFWAELTYLDAEDREVILMRHFEHLTNQEVALVLGLSEAAASMRYLRAMRRLRGRLSPQESDAVR